MAWTDTQLAQARSAFLASGLRTEIEDALDPIRSILSVKVPIQSIALACEKALDEEAKVNQIMVVVYNDLGWSGRVYFLEQMVEFHD